MFPEERSPAAEAARSWRSVWQEARPRAAARRLAGVGVRGDRRGPGDDGRSRERLAMVLGQVAGADVVVCAELAYGGVRLCRLLAPLARDGGGAAQTGQAPHASANLRAVRAQQAGQNA